MLAAFAAAAALAPARFPPRPGWQTGAGRIHACPGVSARRCRSATTFAATVRWRDCVECLPHRTVAQLPPVGIALQISVASERPLRMRARAWPPRIRSRDVGAPFEGLPARIGVFQYSTVVDGYEVLVMVFFGRARPTPATLAEATAELAEARLP